MVDAYLSSKWYLAYAPEKAVKASSSLVMVMPNIGRSKYSLRLGGQILYATSIWLAALTNVVNQRRSGIKVNRTEDVQSIYNRVCHRRNDVQRRVTNSPKMIVDVQKGQERRVV